MKFTKKLFAVPSLVVLLVCNFALPAVAEEEATLFASGPHVIFDSEDMPCQAVYKTYNGPFYSITDFQSGTHNFSYYFTGSDIWGIPVSSSAFDHAELTIVSYCLDYSIGGVDVSFDGVNFDPWAPGENVYWLPDGEFSLTLVLGEHDTRYYLYITETLYFTKPVLSEGHHWFGINDIVLQSNGDGTATVFDGAIFCNNNGNCIDFSTDIFYDFHLFGGTITGFNIYSPGLYIAFNAIYQSFYGNDSINLFSSDIMPESGYYWNATFQASSQGYYDVAIWIDHI